MGGRTFILILNMKKTLYILCAAALLAGCGKQDTFSVPDCQTSYDFEAAGGTVFVTVDSSEPFEASCEDSWVFTQVYEGSNSHNLRITAYENTLAQDRTGTVTVSRSGKSPVTIAVSQYGAEPYITCDPGSVSLEKEDTGFSITVESNAVYTITLPDWVELAEDKSPEIGKVTYAFSLIGTISDGQRRSGYVTFAGADIESKVYVEQIALEMETVTMKWGLEDIQYIWEAFAKTTAAITPTVVSSTDFSPYDRLSKTSGGFSYTNETGTLSFALGSSAQLKINKASSATSTGNINRDGQNVERMQMNKATAEVGENAFVFTAPRSGVLEIEAAAPNSGDKKPMVMVDGKDYAAFTADYVRPACVTTMDIPVNSPDGVEVRIYGTGGAINYFSISYTYQRPKEQ